MITTLKPVLSHAETAHYAVGAFNTSNLETTLAIIEAAEECRSPVILSLSESALKYGGSCLIALVLKAATEAKVPTVVHLDHGRNLDVIKVAINSGFSSIMIDGSALSLEHNIRLTKEVVTLAKRKRLSVEGEIGIIGGKEDKIIGFNIIYPQPDTVLSFIKATRVDALAVGLGTSHGLPVPKEHVELELLSKIKSLTNTPIVLHGASNLPDSTIRASIRRGITKINIDTEIRQAFTLAVRRELRDETLFDIRAYLGKGKEAVKKRIIKKMELFGSAGKGNYELSRHW